MSYTKNNIIFFLLDNTIIKDKNKLSESVNEIADKGFDSILMQIRDTAFQLDSPDAINAIAILTEAAHKKGLKAIMTFITTTCRSWSNSFFQKYPDAGVVNMFSGKGKITNSEINAKIFCNTSLEISGSHSSIFDGIINIFAKENGMYREISCSDISVSIYNNAGFNDKNEWFHDPFTTVEVKAKSDLSDNFPGDIIVYAGFKVGHPDYSSPEFTEFTNYLLDCYKNIPLDGVAWDEPGPPGNWSYHKFSKNIAQLFYKDHGYNLKTKLYALDNDCLEANKVRYDYFVTLRNSIFNAQKIFNDRARKLFGKNIFTGIHHTWTGEGSNTDLKAGCIDYFKLGKNNTGGFTDGGFSDPPSLTYSMKLANSLAMSQNLPSAGYSNCWCFCPTEQKLKHFSRLMGLMNLNWIAHSFGFYVDIFGPGYPNHYTWKEFPSTVNRINKIKDFINNAQAKHKVAVLHSWEALASINHPVINLQKTGMINLAWQFVYQNIGFDFIDTEQLENASVNNNGKICGINDTVYDALILPWCNMISQKAWEQIKTMSNYNGIVVFFGPPCEIANNNQSVIKEFSEITGVMPFSTQEYINQYLSEKRPTYRLTSSDFAFPIQNTETANKLDNYSVKRKNSNTYYFSRIDPSEKIIKIMKQNNCATVDINSQNKVIIEQYFSDKDRVILLSGHFNEPFSCSFCINKVKYEINDMLFAGIKIINNNIYECIGEKESENSSIIINGKKQSFSQIE